MRKTAYGRDPHHVYMVRCSSWRKKRILGMVLNVGTHLGRKTSSRSVLVQMSFSFLRSHFKSPNVISIRKDNDPGIVASLVMYIYYINTWETES